MRSSSPNQDWTQPLRWELRVLATDRRRSPSLPGGLNVWWYKCTRKASHFLQFSVSRVHWPFLCCSALYSVSSCMSSLHQLYFWYHKMLPLLQNILSYASIGKYPHHLSRPFVVVVFSTQGWRNRTEKCIKNELIIKIAKHYKKTLSKRYLRVRFCLPTCKYLGRWCRVVFLSKWMSLSLKISFTSCFQESRVGMMIHCQTESLLSRK